MTEAMNETPATRKAAIWVVIVFLLGTVAGGMLGYGYAAHHSVSAASAPLPEPERRARRVADLTAKLGLTSDQAKQLDAILLGRHTEVKSIHDQSDAQLEQVRQKGRDQIRGILTPEQKPKFEEFLQKLDAERKHNAPR
jgi:flagellar basal body-associated protein FliL